MAQISPEIDHLLRRAGFGVSSEDVEIFRDMSPSTAVAYLVDYEGRPDDGDPALGRPAEETVYHVGSTWYWRFLRNGVSTGYLIVTFDSASIATSKRAIQDAYPGAKF